MRAGKRGAAPRRSRRARCAALAALACAACAHVPPAPIDAAANGARIAARSLHDPRVTAALARHDFKLDGGAWTLDELTLAAWTLRTDLDVARAQVDAARAAVDVAGLKPNPTLTGTSEKVIDRGSEHPWVVGAALALRFETGNKREIRTARALAEQRSLEWQFGEALWNARAAVRKALFDRELALEVADLDARSVALTRGFQQWVETRLAHGAATTSERLAAVQAANEAESRRALDAAALADARATLAAAVGVVPDELARIEPAAPALAELPELSTEQLGAARDAALVNRLDVRRALADYDVAEQALRAAVAAQYPDFTLGPGYLLDQADHKITLALDLPVALKRNASAAIRGAIAARAVAAAKVDDVQAAALAAIDIAFARYRASRDALAAAERAERDATDAVTALEHRLAAGAANRGEVLAAQIALAGLTRGTLDARRAVLDSATALENGIEQPLFPTSVLDPSTAMRELLVGAPQ